MKHFLLATGVWLVFAASRAAAGDKWLVESPWYDELWGTLAAAPDVRLHVNAPAPRPGDDAQPVRLLLFALPNGNTLEQTLGCRMREGLDWHYDIQHIAAQTRLLRTVLPEERITLVAAEAQGLSWPAWRASHEGANERIVELVSQWRAHAGPDARVSLTAHSGGGSFLWGFLEGQDEIPAWVDLIAFLDANYSFDAQQHAAKILRWLRGDASRRLIVLAYDDREITYNGKKVVGPAGGTYRATQRMLDAFVAGDAPLARTDAVPFIEYAGLDGQVRCWVHANPSNKILHTALVGDMNGLLHAATVSTPFAERWGEFAGPRAYATWIQPAPTPANPAAVSDLPPLESLPPLTLPPRPADAVGGAEFAARIDRLPLAEREAAIFAELAAGNFPQFLRTFHRVDVATGGAEGNSTWAIVEAAPDVLAVGSDDDFLRIPMTPQTAQRLADRWGCTLPTRKLVDAIDAAAVVRLAPQPLTEDRESVGAFVLSNERIETQRAGRSPGPLVTGAKKDIVLTPRIFERPRRLALYGWRQLDGTPIQPLTVVHHDGYVDYSHGVRLVRNAALIDGKAYAVSDLLADPRHSRWVSDEGPMNPPRYP